MRRVILTAAMLVASWTAWAGGCYKAAPNPGYVDAQHFSPCGPDDQWTASDVCCPPGYFHLYEWQKIGEWTGMGGKYGFDVPVGHEIVGDDTVHAGKAGSEPLGFQTFYYSPQLKQTVQEVGAPSCAARVDQVGPVITCPPDCGGSVFCVPQPGISPAPSPMPAPVIVVPSLPRTYTLAELGRMRAAVRSQVFTENCIKGSDGIYLCPFPPQMAGMVEDRLRTDMLAGISPEALEETLKR